MLRHWLVLLASLYSLCVSAQEAGIPYGTNGTSQISHPVDQIWYEHLAWRIQQPLGPDNDVELVCRDILRMVPLQPEPVRRLYTLYRDHDAQALATMAACLLEFQGDPNAAPLVAEGFATVTSRPAEPGIGPEWIAAQNFYDESLERGLACIRAQDLVGAENAFRSVLHTFPRNQAALTYLGIVNVLRSDWPMTMMVFDYAHRLYPEDVDFIASRARAQGYLGQAPEALAWLQKYLIRYPETPPLLQTAGLIAMQCGRPLEATRYFAAWAACDGKNADAWTNYGIALTLTEQPVFARVALSKARQMDPARNSLLLFLALNAARSQRSTEMKAYVRDLVAQAGREEAARLIRGSHLSQYFPDVEDYLR